MDAEADENEEVILEEEEESEVQRDPEANESEEVVLDLKLLQRIPGIVWPDGIAPNPLKFYGSAADWDMIEEAPRLRSDQVQDDSPSLDNELSYLLFLAVPRISQLLADMDTSNPIIESHEASFTDNFRLYTARKSIDWMRAYSFDPTPALEAMLVEPLAALVEHPLLDQDIDAVRKIFGLGSVFLQLLAIQHSLGEAWDLNGQTFADIQTGLLLASPPSAVRGMDAMWASADPIIVAGENQLSTAQLATFEAIFNSAHTHYFTNSPVVFYKYNWHSAAPPMELPRPHIRIQHQGQDILLAGHLPVDTRSKKRRFRAVEAPIVPSDAPPPVVTASRKRGCTMSPVQNECWTKVWRWH
ncbi:hypothetical protein B0H13DRAFT_1857428 [Mycena leptocephala]|nr:hypothetical protein B0H13DRAFT_1857428 [Mycena leptocephala]